MSDVYVVPGTGTSASATSGFQSVESDGVVPSTSGFQSVAPAGVVPSTADVQRTGSDGVVPSCSSVPSTTSGVVIPICAFPSVDVDPTPTTIPDFQPVITAAIESSSVVSPPAVELTDFREIEINPLFSQDESPIIDMSMFLDVGLMDGRSVGRGAAAMCGLYGGEREEGTGAAAWDTRGGAVRPGPHRPHGSVHRGDGRPRYLIMFVDSPSRLQRAYGMRAKSDTLRYVKRFLADMNGMGTPRCFRMDNGGEFTGAAFIEFCDAAGIRREYTAPDTPKQNAVAESSIWRAMKGGHAVRRHILSMPHVDLASVPNIGANGQRLWLSSALWASGCFNRSVTKANQGWASPFEAFFGRKPPLNVVPVFLEGMMRVKRASKADVQSVRCFYLHGANNHLTATAVVLRASTGRLALTNFVWVNRRAGAPGAGAGHRGGFFGHRAALAGRRRTCGRCRTAAAPASENLHLATQTRPDIANAVRKVARYCASPKMVHWKAALGILGYVRRTSWMGITCERGVVTGMSMQVFVDADYASKAAGRRSVSGGLVMCGCVCVTWFSRTQKCVTLSTTEAEYVAIADALKEVLFLRQVLWRFMLPDAGMPCIPVFEDNQGAIQIANNPITNSNSKHIDVRHHFIRELVERKEISITHVPTQFQHADFLTKAIRKESFALHRDFVMNLM
ncbi:unnamed protein product [Ectocarpus sp. CCAP 1310/34]|nr:unnamed protein product [Ectocarpus sp. CCAP 1310/34]